MNFKLSKVILLTIWKTFIFDNNIHNLIIYFSKVIPSKYTIPYLNILSCFVKLYKISILSLYDNIYNMK